MTNEEVKAAFIDECPVVYDGIQYQRISGLIYRKRSAFRGVYMRAELLDRNNNAVVVVAPDRIEFVKEEAP
jgi:hypothetical protein